MEDVTFVKVPSFSDNLYSRSAVPEVISFRRNHPTCLQQRNSSKLLSLDSSLHLPTMSFITDILYHQDLHNAMQCSLQSSIYITVTEHPKQTKWEDQYVLKVKMLLKILLRKLSDSIERGIIFRIILLQNHGYFICSIFIFLFSLLVGNKILRQNSHIITMSSLYLFIHRFSWIRITN